MVARTRVLLAPPFQMADEGGFVHDGEGHAEKA